MKKVGHQVDLLDLCAEGFDPVLSEEGRRHYHDESRNRRGLEPLVARLQTAEALAIQFPTWYFGPPAMLKGFFDRLFMPGVAFDISNPAKVAPMLGNVKKIAGVVTYGRPRLTAFYMGAPRAKSSPVTSNGSRRRGRGWSITRCIISTWRRSSREKRS